MKRLNEEFERKYIMDTTTPRYTLLSGRYKKSFAYKTIHERLPVTLTEIVDRLTRDYDEIANNYAGEETREELKLIVGKISKLKYQLQTDKKLEKFDGEETDKELWNKFIAELPKDQCSFFRTCFLYSECFMYRKVNSFFENSKTLKNFDVFKKQKEASLKVDCLVRIAKAVRRVERDPKVLAYLFKLSLWANKCDLSLKVASPFNPDDNLFEQLHSYDSKVLVDELELVWQCFEEADHSNPIIVEFICDNTGIEIYADLILADYLIDKRFATKIRFSLKPIPWFISDVTVNDFNFTLDYIANHPSAIVKEMGLRWKQYMADGKFVISPQDYFWVSPYEYYKMREINPVLNKYLAEAFLVIFKGDLNYRKLLGDMCWDPTDHFLTCLRGFRPTNMLALRTLKADLICGLPQGKAEELDRLDTQWMCNGDYGVMQFMDRRECKCVFNE